MELSSPAFGAGTQIPRRFTCEGQDLAPALQWSGVPAGAKSLALIVDDPDAPDPDAPQRTWVHWVLFDLPPDSAGLPEGGQPLPHHREHATQVAGSHRPFEQRAHRARVDRDEPAPAAPAANKARLFCRDNGSGKTQLAAIFPTGAVQVIATEP